MYLQSSLWSSSNEGGTSHWNSGSSGKSITLSQNSYSDHNI